MTEDKQLLENMTNAELVAEAGRLRKELEKRAPSGQKPTNELNESNKTLLKMLNQHSPTGIFRTDSKGQLIFANQRWLHMFDFKADDIQSLDWTKAVRLTDMEMTRSAWAHSVSQIEPLNMEFVCRHKTGEEYWVYWQSVPEFNENGVHTGFIGSCTDISSQKKIQNDHDEQTVLIESIFKNIPDALLMTDLDREIIMLNPGATALLGYEPEELLGRNISLIYAHKDDYLEQGKIRFNATTETANTTFFLEYRRKDGSTFPAEVTYTPVVDLQDTNTGFLGLVRDITERLEIHQKLEESEARANDFAEVASDWFWETDQDLRITYMSEKYVESSDTPINQMIGKTRREILMQTGAPITEEWDYILQKLENHEDYTNFVYSKPLKNGSQRYLSSSGKTLFDTKGTFVGYRGVGSDVTEKVEHEEALLKAKEDAEQASISKSEFLSAVSHELRTPLTSIRGALGLVLGGAAGELAPDTKDMVMIAYNNSERLSQLINDILNLEKIQSGKLDYEMEELDVKSLIEKSVEANKHYADSFNVKLGMFAPHKGAIIMGDMGRLMQVMDNFLSNAIKFSPEGETVTVSLEVNEGRVRISIQDKGPGIPKSFHSKLFLAFTQADGSDTRVKGGTGLGLGIAKSIVERHGGHIHFDTEQDNGTTFHTDLRLLYQS